MGGQRRSIPRGRRLQLVPLGGYKENLQGLGRFKAKDERVFHPTELAMRLKDECKSLKQDFVKLKEHISKYRSIML